MWLVQNILCSSASTQSQHDSSTGSLTLNPSIEHFRKMDLYILPNGMKDKIEEFKNQMKKCVFYRKFI